MSQAPATQEVRRPLAVEDVTGMKRDLFDVFKQAVCPALNDPQAVMYAARCRAKGLDPMSKPFHSWIDKGTLQMPMEIHGIIALAQSRGTFRLGRPGAQPADPWRVCDFLDAQGTVTSIEKDIEECAAYGQLRDDQGEWHTVQWSVYCSDLKHLFGKDNWKQFRHMLRIRAIANLVRIYCADLLGDVYTPDEAKEFARSEAITVNATEYVDAKLLDPAKTEPPKEPPPPVVAPKTEAIQTPLPADVQAAKKARWDALSRAFCLPAAYFKADVQAACEQLGIPKDASTWTDEQAKAIEDAVRSMRQPPEREPGLDLDDGSN